MTKEEIIKALDMVPHPEGGFYKETYRSQGEIPQSALEGYPGSRNICTAIYFLLTSENHSAFHRVRQDELWHFHQGASIELHQISPEGSYEKIRIGNDLKRGDHPQHTVPGGYWFAANVDAGGDHSLVSCTVAPGFDFLDFELADDSLAERYPQHATFIRQFLAEKD